MAAPSNNNFISAIQLSGTSFSQSGTNVEATEQSGERSGQYNSVWYYWEAPATGYLVLSIGETSWWGKINVYIGTSLSTLNFVNGGGNNLSFEVTSGTVYRIAVYSFFDVQPPSMAWASITGTFTLTGTYYSGEIIHITDSTGLRNIENLMSGVYVLDNDIDLDGIDWAPIGAGKTTVEFTGIFDGQGYTIRNMTCSAATAAIDC